jgi:tetratricopeptide (TPR) repeat protein
MSRILATVVVMVAACELSPGGDTRPQPVPQRRAQPQPVKPVAPPPPPVEPAVVEARASGGQAALDLADPGVVQAVMTAFANRLRDCASGYAGKLSVTVAVTAAGAVEAVTVEPRDAAPSHCVAAVIRSISFPTNAPARFRYAINFAACNAAALAKQGDASTAAGNHKAALATFEAALACTHDSTIVPRAYAAACNAGAAGKAQAYFVQLPKDRQEHLASLCTARGIDPVPVARRYDPDKHAMIVALEEILPQMLMCNDYTISQTLTAEIHFAGDTSVDAVAVTPAVPMGRCIADVVRRARFDPAPPAGVLTYPMRFSVPPAVFACRAATADELAAHELTRRGRHLEALELYLGALRCNRRLATNVVMAACAAHQPDMARRYLHLVPRDQRPAARCLTAGELRAAEPDTCQDNGDEVDGDASMRRGEYDLAFRAYNVAARCRASVAPKALVAACHAKAETEARAIFAGITEDRQYLQDVCLRDGIDPRPRGP